MRVVPIIGTALLCVVTFTLAGGFSSQLSTGISNDVLLDGSNCGIVDTSTYAAGSPIFAYVSTEASNAANYAQQCYSANTSHTFDCTTYVKPRLPSTVDYNAPCPFQDDICRSNNSNIRLDTGYIDTLEHLGINLPERTLYRSILHCAPLVTEGYSENVSRPDIGNMTRYFYGETTIPDSGVNFSYEAPSQGSQYFVNRSDDHFINRGLNLQLAYVLFFPLFRTLLSYRCVRLQARS